MVPVEVLAREARRVAAGGVVAGAGMLLTEPIISNAASFVKPAESYTVKQIMDMARTQKIVREAFPFLPSCYSILV